MIYAIIDMFVKTFPVFQHYLRKGDAYEEEFYSEELKLKGTVFDKDEGARIYTFMDVIKEEKTFVEIPNMEQLYVDTLVLSEDNTAPNSTRNKNISFDLNAALSDSYIDTNNLTPVQSISRNNLLDPMNIEESKILYVPMKRKKTEESYNEEDSYF